MSNLETILKSGAKLKVRKLTKNDYKWIKSRCLEQQKCLENLKYIDYEGLSKIINI